MPELKLGPTYEAVQIHLVDGTYELFRHFFAMPSHRDADGREVAAVRGVVASILGMISAGATHVGVATDHVIESFRNRLWRGYKTSAGVDPALLAQHLDRFGSLENLEIRAAVCEILEGGERAFLDRERRYRLNLDRI